MNDLRKKYTNTNLHARRRPINGSPAVRSGTAVYSISEKYGGIEDTIKRIIALINEGKKSARVRGTTILAASDVNFRDYYRVAERVYAWIVQNIRYVRDPFDVEYLQSAEVTLDTKAADCDCLVILAGAMLQSVGIPVRLRVVGRNDYEHIYIEFHDGQNWIAFDPTIQQFATAPRFQQNKFNKTHELTDGLGLAPVLITGLTSLVGGVVSGVASNKAAKTNAEAERARYAYELELARLNADAERQKFEVARLQQSAFTNQQAQKNQNLMYFATGVGVLVILSIAFKRKEVQNV